MLREDDLYLVFVNFILSGNFLASGLMQGSKTPRLPLSLFIHLILAVNDISWRMWRETGAFFETRASNMAVNITLQVGMDKL